MAFAATWMDPEILIMSEVRQSQYNVMLLMYGILKKKKTHNRKQKQTQRLKRMNLWLPEGKEGREG